MIKIGCMLNVNFLSFFAGFSIKNMTSNITIIIWQRKLERRGGRQRERERERERERVREKRRRGHGTVSVPTVIMIKPRRHRKLFSKCLIIVQSFEMHQIF